MQLEARAESASVPLRQECAEKTLALQEARKQAQALQRFLLSAATLQDTDIHAGPGFAYSTTELTASRSNLSRRRRTFDPASFSTPALNRTCLHSNLVLYCVLDRLPFIPACPLVVKHILILLLFVRAFCASSSAASTVSSPCT